MRAEELLDSLLELSQAVLYVAIHPGKGEPVLRQRQGASLLPEREYWDEQLVNPTLLDLLRRRGELDGGGVEYVVIKFANFTQLVLPLVTGHLSLCVEPALDPIPMLGTIRALAEVHGAVLPPRA